MSEEVVQIATLKSEVKTLTEAVRELTQSMQRNNERLERLAVLEASHTNSNSAIQRAFEAIQKVENAEAARSAENEQAHKSYDKAIWSAVGFVAAVSVFWSVFGYQAKTTMDEMVKMNVLLQQHITQDKILTEADVAKAHKVLP
jgi:CRISPR/Cas system-associated exonuclease Cas4 (RecB family)